MVIFYFSCISKHQSTVIQSRYSTLGWLTSTILASSSQIHWLVVFLVGKKHHQRMNRVKVICCFSAFIQHRVLLCVVPHDEVVCTNPMYLTSFILAQLREMGSTICSTLVLLIADGSNVQLISDSFFIILIFPLPVQNNLFFVCFRATSNSAWSLLLALCAGSFLKSLVYHMDC